MSWRVSPQSRFPHTSRTRGVGALWESSTNAVPVSIARQRSSSLTRQPMNDSAERNVVVKLEVSVPVGSGAHVSGLSPSLLRAAGGPPINNLGVLNVSYPTANQHGVAVKVSVLSNQGVICAGGTSIDSGNRPGKFILAKVIPGVVSGTPDATGATVAVPDMYGRWSINNLGTAVCSAGSGSLVSTL